MRIGLAVICYNRCEITRNTIERVRRHTKTDYELIVVDDGSTDSTRDMLGQISVPYISGFNCGVVWNKNRAIFYLHQVRKCDVIILLEEDTYPTKDGWERIWVEGAQLWGHVNFAPDHWALNDRLGGVGTPSDPIISRYVTGQCSAFSSEALAAIGYLDTRFHGYGFEHAEHTIRFLRAGWGGYIEEDGNTRAYYLLRSTLKVTCLDKAPPRNEILHNGKVFDSIKRDSLHRWCWRNDEEMAIFYSAFSTLSGSGLPTPALAKQSWLLTDNQGRSLKWDANKNSVVAVSSRRDPRLCVVVTVKDTHAFFCVLSPEISWLKWDALGSTRKCSNQMEASAFMIKKGKTKGLGFLSNGFYLCSDHNDGDRITLSRREMLGWETFHFANYAL